MMHALRFAGFLLAVVVAVAEAAPPPGVIDAARREGKLIWWTSGSAADSVEVKKSPFRPPFSKGETPIPLFEKA